MGKIKYFLKEELWPHITYVYKNEPKKVSSDFISRQTDLNLLLEEARGFYNSEIDRMKQVENKASIGLGITSILSTIITLLFGSLSVSDNYQFEAIDLICLFLFLMFSIGAIWYTIQAHERKNYGFVNVSEFFSNSARELKFSLIEDYMNAAYYNQAITNKKVDSMYLAQKWFRNAILCICAWGMLKTVGLLYAICSNWITSILS